jgi:hypothetical protein
VLAERLGREPELARLHQALASADAVVRAELRALPAATMPSDLAANLDALIAAEPPLSPASAPPQSATATATDTTATDTTATDATAEGATAAATATDAPAEGTVVPLRARRPRWAVQAGAVAAGVALLGGIAAGSALLLHPARQEPSSVNSAAGPAYTSAESAPETGSGTNYTAATLATQVSTLLKSPRSADKHLVTPANPQAHASGPSLLGSCLEALGFTGRAIAVDHGTYEGAPALVVVANQAAGNPDQVDVAVVGPDCGRAGTDERLRTTVPRQG